jgi:hypothetical protein
LREIFRKYHCGINNRNNRKNNYENKKKGFRKIQNELKCPTNREMKFRACTCGQLALGKR